MSHRSSSAAFGRLLGLVAAIATFGAAEPARAAFITYTVNLTFDPNSTPTMTLGAAGPGTVTGTFTIDTTIPIDTINSPPPAGAQVTNLVSANLLEASNNGTILSGFSNSTTQVFNDVTPYVITFIGSPVTIYPNSAYYAEVNGVLYERVFFNSPPIIDSIQEGPSIVFDFPVLTGGNVIPGNFDSFASTGFNSYLYGTVLPSSVPEPGSLCLVLVGLAGTLAVRRRLRRSA
jgi:hypothetical protein